MNSWWDHVTPYIPFMLTAEQHTRTSFKSVTEGLIIAAIGGAIGTVTALAVLKTELIEFRRATEKAIERMEVRQDKQGERLRTIERHQAVQEGQQRR